MAVNKWYLDFNAAKSDGTLPLDHSARAMRYKRAFIWKVDVTTIGINGGLYKGGWTVEITNETGAIVFFKHHVTLTLFLVSLGVPGAVLFTWAFQHDEFDTSVVAAFPTTKENVGQFLQGGTALSEQGNMIPGGGADTTDMTATIIADWESPIYLFKSPGQTLPPRSKVKITKDQWNLGPASVEYGWAFDEATPAPVGTLFDGLGSLVVGCSGEGIGREGSGRVHVARSWPLDDYKYLDRGAPVKGDYPTFHETKDGRLILSMLGVEGVVEYQSWTSGLSWERVKYIVPDSVAPKEGPIFSPGVDMPSSLKIDDETRLHIAMRASNLVWSLVDANGPSPEQLVGVIEDADLAIPSIEATPDGGYLIIGGAGVPVYTANSTPPKWNKIAGGSK
jgi:hypothetical protein